MKNILAIIGILLIIGTIAGGNLSHISDWDNAEMLGSNAWTIVAIVGGATMAYFGLKKNKKIN